MQMTGTGFAYRTDRQKDKCPSSCQSSGVTALSNNASPGGTDNSDRITDRRKTNREGWGSSQERSRSSAESTQTFSSSSEFRSFYFSWALTSGKGRAKARAGRNSQWSQQRPVAATRLTAAQSRGKYWTFSILDSKLFQDRWLSFAATSTFLVMPVTRALQPHCCRDITYPSKQEPTAGLVLQGALLGDVYPATATRRELLSSLIQLDTGPSHATAQRGAGIPSSCTAGTWDVCKGENSKTNCSRAEGRQKSVLNFYHISYHLSPHPATPQPSAIPAV